MLNKNVYCVINTYFVFISSYMYIYIEEEEEEEEKERKRPIHFISTFLINIYLSNKVVFSFMKLGFITIIIIIKNNSNIKL